MVRAFDTPIITNDHSIDRVLAAGQPVLFLFMSGSVPATLEPVLKRLAKEQAGRLLVVQAPAADSPNALRRYQLSRLPAVVTIRDGQVLSKAEAVSAAELEQHAAFLLGQAPRPPAASSPQARTGSAEGRPRNATDASFEQEALRSPQPVLVDFWAPWCGPCRMAEPVLEKLAREQASHLRVVKVNVDENPATARRYGVQSIPTMLLLKNGQVADRWVGALPEVALRNRVMPWLGR